MKRITKVIRKILNEIIDYKDSKEYINKIIELNKKEQKYESAKIYSQTKTIKSIKTYISYYSLLVMPTLYHFFINIKRKTILIFLKTTF